MPYSFTAELIKSGMTYTDYLELFENLVARQATTGPDQSPAMVEYTKMNLTRSNRMNKVTMIPDSIKEFVQSITTPLYFILITEPWCGDAAHSVPGIAALAKQNPLIDFRVFLRDEHPEVMNHYLTNGGKAIPILVVLRQDNLEELFHWGPRPIEAQEIVMSYKKKGDFKKEDMVNDVFKWYNQDKNLTLMDEIAASLKITLSQHVPISK
ncbi:MAG: thioredoxin family protein [Cytophagaceae bacterium]